MSKGFYIGWIVKVILALLISTPCQGLDNPDSLENLLQKKLNPEQKLNVILSIAKIKYNEGDHHCLIYAEDALALADSLNINEKIAEASHISGLAWKLCGDNSTAIIKLYNAAEIYNLLKITSKYSLTLTDIGETYRANGNQETSLEYLNKALTLQIEIGDSVEMAKTYNRLAASNYEIFISKNSYQQFIKSANQTRSELKRIIDADKNLKQCLDSTVRFIALSENTAEHYNLKETIISNQTILGALYSAIFEFEKADSILSIALELIEKEGVEKDRPLIYYNFSRLRKNQKKYEEAIAFSTKAFELAQKNDTKIYRLLSSYLLGELYQKVNKPFEAIKYMNIAQNEISFFYKNDLGLRINALQYQNELDKRESKLLLQSTKTRYLTHFLIYIFIVFFLFFIVISIKNKKLKKLNLQLERKNQTIAIQNNELTTLNAEKDKFFSIIAHDLRGPLGTFVSITDLLTEEIQKNRIEKVKLLSDSLQIVSYHLYGLLENLLDWSRVQRNSIVFTSERVKLNVLIEDSIRVISDGAERKGIAINYNFSDSLEITTDSYMLQTIIRNLTANAIKYTPEGGNITITAKTNNSNITVCVEDTGIGMNQEIIGGLFKLNSNSNRIGTNHEPSTGLGLVLCKEFADKIGATISVESEVGKGSRFTICLPNK